MAVLCLITLQKVKKVNMVSCNNCLMNDSIEEFKILEDGKCNFCIDWKIIKKNIQTLIVMKLTNLLSLKKLIKKKLKILIMIAW